MTTTKVIALLAATLLASCAHNQPQLVYRGVQTKLDHTSNPPANFVVTLDEARSAIPLTKTSWDIYADRTHYYLLSTASAPKIKTSHAIRYYGNPISGLTRTDIDRIDATWRKRSSNVRTRGCLFPADLPRIIPSQSDLDRAAATKAPTR